eukprot:gene2630-2931_t
MARFGGGWPRYDRYTYQYGYPGNGGGGGGGGSWNGGGGSYNWRPQGYYWPPAYNCNYRGCFRPCPNPAPISAWDFISSTKELSFLASLLRGTMYQAALEADFAGTVLAPTNAAFDAYYKTFSPDLIMVLDNDYTRTSMAWNILNTHFWPPLLSYHVLTDAVFAKDFQAGTWYDTFYSNPNGQPHKVYFGSEQVPVVYGPTTSKYAPRCRLCKSTRFYWMDEQNKVVTMSMADKWIKGGGAVHLVNSVLQPNDIFPSARAALVFHKYTDLLSVMEYVNNSPWANNLGRLIETTPTTFAAPNNAAFKALLVALNGTLPPANVASYVLGVHSCPLSGGNAVATNLLYTPFTKGINPCLTELAIRWNQADPKLKFAKTGTTYNVQLTPGNQAPVKIVLPDVTYPMGVGHGIDKVLLPPA